jgi:hypothetical protein
MPRLCNSSIIIVNHQFIAFTKQIGEISAHLEADPRLVPMGQIPQEILV